MSPLKRAVTAAVIVVLAACGGDNPLVPNGTTLTIQGGNNQTLALTATTPTPLAVLVKDGQGAPLAGVPMTWAIVSGGGALGSIAASGADGIATATYTAGTSSGPKIIRVTVPGSTDSAVFSLAVQPGTPKRLVKASGDA